MTHADDFAVVRGAVAHDKYAAAALDRIAERQIAHMGACECESCAALRRVCKGER